MTIQLICALCMDASEQAQEQGGLLREVIAGAAMLSRWTLLSERSFGDAESRARGTVFVPIVGFAAGVIFSLADRAIGAIVAEPMRSIAIVLIVELVGGGIDVLGIADLFDAIRRGSRPASTGIARIGPLGAAVGLGWVALAAWLLARIDAPEGRSAALVMATMLSRWSIVPIAYGLKPLERWGLGIPFEGGIRFREFAASSAVALGLAMGLYESVGLAVLVALALAILGLRLLLSKRLGGVSGYTLAGSAAICELLTLAVLVALRI